MPEKIELLKVKKVMKKKVVIIPISATLEEAAKILEKYMVSGAPVVRNKKMIGIISEKDLLKALYPDFGDILADIGAWFKGEKGKKIESKKKTPIEAIMTHDVITVSPESTLIEAGSVMFAHSIHRLPVVNKKGELVGFVARRDIFRKLLHMEI